MMPIRWTDEDHIEIKRYLERYYGCAYGQIPKTERFYRFINEIHQHFKWARDMETPEDMTVAEYAIRLWELGPNVKDFIQAEVDRARGIPAHAAYQSELCTCLYCEFFNAGRVVFIVRDDKVLQIRVNGKRSDEPKTPRPSVEPVD
jgi:hypothetical protein